MSTPPDGILLSELRHVVDELQDLVGAPVRKVWVPSPDQVVIAFGRGPTVLIERWPIPRMHATNARPSNPKTPYSFQGLLRSRLAGRLEALRIVGDDRVVELDIGSLTVHARLFGRGGGIWLREDARVLGAVDGPAPEHLPELPEAAPRPAPPRFQPESEETWNAAADRWFQHHAEAWGDQRWRDHVRKGLTRAIKRQRRLVRNLTNDLDGAEAADELRAKADSLAAVLHTVKRGASSVSVPDLVDPDVMHEVSLDPSRPATEALGKLYDKAGRLARAMDGILDRLTREEERLAQMESDRATVDAEARPALQRLARSWRLGEPGVAKRPDDHVRPPWDTWHGPHGEQVLVGRSEASNRALTFKHARGRDWWLHLRDLPGSHVVIRRNRKEPPPLDLLLAAAQLVLHYARVAEGTAHDVQYARVADLRSLPTKGVAGVAVTREKVLHVTRDPQVLQGWSRNADR